MARPALASSECALLATLTGPRGALLKHADSAIRIADGRILDKLGAPQQREFKRMLYQLGSN